MLEGKTASGFEFTIEDEVLDDYELLEVIHKVDTGHDGYIVDMAKMILGEDQVNKLKEHCKKDNGKVSAIRVVNEMAEIFAVSKKLKN